MTTIKYKDVEYKIKDSSLEIQQAAMPLLIEYRKMRAEYLDDIDRSLIDSYKTEINNIETAISQIKDDETQTEYLKSLEEKLRDVKSKYENDEEVKITEAMINDVEGLLLASLALNTPVMKKLFSKILIGDLSKIDYSDEEYKAFAVNVLINFFLIMQPSKEK